jgi:oligopeptide/dipeptide ABC transporter ATP-binding protein
MYLGKIVELAGHAELYENPLHPYTEALFSAAPRLDTDKARISERIRLKGELPSPLRRPPGCAFEPRCPRRMDICRTVEPPLLAYDEGHLAACHAVESEIGPGRSVSSTAGVET